MILVLFKTMSYYYHGGLNYDPFYTDQTICKYNVYMAYARKLSCLYAVFVTRVLLFDMSVVARTYLPIYYNGPVFIEDELHASKYYRTGHLYPGRAIGWVWMSKMPWISFRCHPCYWIWQSVYHIWWNNSHTCIIALSSLWVMKWY